MSNRPMTVVSAGVLAAAMLALAACSSAGSGAATPASAAASSAPAASASGQPAGTDAMRALCDQMVADKLSLDDATALAEKNGFIARVGTLEGQPQAVTMDYREDRFTFDIEGGVVVGCTYG
jgi:hypothetical protein